MSQQHCSCRCYTMVRQKRAARCNMGGRALKKPLCCLQRRPLLCPPASHRTHKTDAKAHKGLNARLIFRASADGYATVWAQQVRHADGGTLRGARRQRRTARAIFKAAIHVIGKVGPDAASFCAQAEMEGWGKKHQKTTQSTTVDDEYLRSGAAIKGMDCQR